MCRRTDGSRCDCRRDGGGRCQVGIDDDGTGTPRGGRGGIHDDCDFDVRGDGRFHRRKEESITAGLAVGATIAMEAFVAGPLTKASMNPARSLGPALVSGYTENLWIYLVAPIAGALCGGFLYLLMQNEEETQEAAS